MKRGVLRSKHRQLVHIAPFSNENIGVQIAPAKRCCLLPFQNKAFCLVDVKNAPIVNLNATVCNHLSKKDVNHFHMSLSLAFTWV